MKAVITGMTLSTDSDKRFGLSQISLSGLSELVAVAGANGAGKSRLLRCIAAAVKSHNDLSDLQTQLPILQGELANHKNAVLVYEKQLEDGIASAASQVKNYNNAISATSKKINEISRSIDVMAKLAVSNSNDIVAVHIGPIRKPVLDVGTATSTQLSKAGEIATAMSAASGQMDQAMRAIWEISQQYISATSSSVVNNPDKIKAATERYKKLQKLVELLLQTKLEHRVDCAAVLFGQPLDLANLSEGQMILLQFAVTLASVEDDSACVILLDEPETHLHPAAQIALVTNLAKALPNGQIILATHSVPLLAHVGAHRTLSMIDGAVKKVEKDIQTVLGTLIGDFDNIAKMRDFIDEADHLAAIAFARECLKMPLTLPFKPNDPQLKQMMDGLACHSDHSLRLIDWGAGRGRLATALAEHFIGQGRVPSECINYFAYNPKCSEPERVACLDAMSALGLAEVESHLLDCENRVVSEFNKDGADVVVLCNVLHEIDPRYWSDTFNLIVQALRETGTLIIVEDLEIPTGEMAFPDGFFLVDKEGVAALLSCTQAEFETRTVDDARYQDRLVCYVIKRTLLTKVTAKTIDAAIDIGQKRALGQLRKLRNECEKDPICDEREGRRRGRRHALYAQQVANAALFFDKKAEATRGVDGRHLDQTEQSTV
jgi:predicted ATPase